jgi:oxygen-independent coproporphyrinogen-3 oxidase
MAGRTAVDFEEEVSERVKAGERAAFGMRTNSGLPFSESLTWELELREAAGEGLVIFKGDRWLLTARGRLLADTVAEIFV